LPQVYSLPYSAIRCEHPAWLLPWKPWISRNGGASFKFKGIKTIPCVIRLPHMPKARSLILACLLVFGLKLASSAQDDCVYRITTSECLHEPKDRVLTGFIVKGTRGIFTALHGVIDAKHIGAVSRGSKEAFSSLEITQVDAEADVALLDSPELDGKSLAGLQTTGFSETVDPGKLWVSGYPLGLDLMHTLDLLLRSHSLVELRSLLTPDAIGAVQERGSPFYRAKMLSIQGKFLPGHSGAPVLDSMNRVLAIANGGLKGGQADISWAFPMNNLGLESTADSRPMLDRLRNLKPDAVFFFAEGPDRRKTMPDTERSLQPSQPPTILSSSETQQRVQNMMDEFTESLLGSSFVPDSKTTDIIAAMNDARQGEHLAASFLQNGSAVSGILDQVQDYQERLENIQKYLGYVGADTINKAQTLDLGDQQKEWLQIADHERVQAFLALKRAAKNVPLTRPPEIQPEQRVPEPPTNLRIIQ
jgi:Trypsin-like peptidase domain